MEYLPWYVVYGHLIGVMVPVLFAAAAVGYVLLTRKKDKRPPWRFVKAAVLAAMAGFLFSTCLGSLSYMEATQSPRGVAKTYADCIDELKPTFLASTSLWHRSDALSQIRLSID